eukprot:7301188-Pyramimonas_sp.AAC.1
MGCGSGAWADTAATPLGSLKHRPSALAGQAPEPIFENAAATHGRSLCGALGIHGRRLWLSS